MRSMRDGSRPAAVSGETVRSGGDLERIGGSDPCTKDLVCPDGSVIFRLTAKKLGNENFFKGRFFE